jgi:hypothetical protein
MLQLVVQERQDKEMLVVAVFINQVTMVLAVGVVVQVVLAYLAYLVQPYNVMVV